MVRPVLVVLHRYIGMATAIFLCIVGAMGAPSAYHQPLFELLSPDLYQAPGRGALLGTEQLT